MRNYIIISLVLGYCTCENFRLELGNPDDTAKIERPCQSYDVNCIRKFFSQHAACKPTYGPTPDPLVRPQNNDLYVPKANMTVTVIDQVIRGLNGRVDQFFLNRKTDKLVIAIEFRNLSMESNTLFFRFHRRAKEPIVTSGSSSVLYPSVLITAVIPRINDLQLEQAESVAFVNTAIAPFFISPSAAESSDPQVQASLAAFVSDLPTLYQELYLVDAEYYAVTFIQYNICDFGLLVF